jgi:glyoxylase-like metal-dependent hydrolase (beta-lactamase superfamily II)
MPAPVTTIDTAYAGHDHVAAAYLLHDRDGAEEVFAFVETNTNAAVPRLLAALHAAGGRPEQVRYVIVTHIHLDHAGGVGALMAALPHATLLAHPRAAPHAIDPSRIEAGARNVYGDAFDALYGTLLPVPEHRVTVLEDGEAVSLGARTLRAWHTRGHANHHLVLHDDGADTVFTGDAFGLLYPTLQGEGVLAVPSTTPTDFDPPAAKASVDRILALGAGAVHPTHFGEHRGRARLEDAGAQLHALLDAHAAIAHEADAAGLDGEALDAFCLRGVEAALRGALAQRGLPDSAWPRLSWDAQLNAQGVAFLVRKWRYKRANA